MTVVDVKDQNDHAAHADDGGYGLMYPQLLMMLCTTSHDVNGFNSPHPQPMFHMMTLVLMLMLIIS